MTIDELSERYNIEVGKLKYFAENHLIETEQSYNGEDEKRLSVMCTLYETGLNAGEIKQFLLFGSENNRAEQIRLLNMHRSDLLEDIHARQKSLDQLDYMLYKLKNSKERGVV